MTYQSIHSLLPWSTGDREGGGSQGVCHDPQTLRNLKLSQSSKRLLWLTPVTCGFSWVSWEEKSACAHTNNLPSRTDLGKSWKMLPDLLPFLPIIKIKTFEFFPSKKIRKKEHTHNISCWDLADLQVQLKAGIWTGGVALQEKSRCHITQYSGLVSPLKPDFATWT